MNFRAWASLLTIMACVATWAEDTLPADFVARYDVQYSGANVAETTLSLTRQTDSALHELRSVSEPRGLAALIRYGDVVEESHFQTREQQLIPVDYRFNDGTRKGKRNSTIFFDWEDASAQSTYKSENANFTLVGPELDRLLLQLRIMMDLRDERLAPSYSVIDRNEVKQYDFEVKGTEVLSTPAGQFSTVKIRRQRPGSSRATIIWAAVEKNYVPVKMVQTIDERPNVVLSLTELEIATELDVVSPTEPAPSERNEADPPDTD